MQSFCFLLFLKLTILEMKIEVIFQCDKVFQTARSIRIVTKNQPTNFILGFLISIFLESITQVMRQDPKPGEDSTCQHCFVPFNSSQKGTWRLQKKDNEVQKGQLSACLISPRQLIIDLGPDSRIPIPYVLLSHFIVWIIITPNLSLSMSNLSS